MKKLFGALVKLFSLLAVLGILHQTGVADGAAVASVFPGDGDHVIFHNVPSLKQQLFSLSV